MKTYTLSKNTPVKVLNDGLEWSNDNFVDEVIAMKHSFSTNSLSLHPVNFRRSIYDPKRKYEKQLWYGFRVKGKTILVRSDFIIIENQIGKVGFIALSKNG